MNSPQEFTTGEPVYVHAMGSWYAGTIAKVGRSRVTVRYVSGTGVVRRKSVNPLDDRYRGFGPTGDEAGALVRKLADRPERVVWTESTTEAHGVNR